MVKYYISNSAAKLEEVEAFTQRCWVNAINPSDDEVEEISRSTGISEDMLKAALDEEELSRYETDDGNNMYIFDVPYIDEEHDLYSYDTIPVSFIYNARAIVTVCLQDNCILRDFIANRIKNISTQQPIMFLLNFMLRNASKFLLYLKQIDRSSLRVQAELHRSLKNKELIELLELENSLVYFSASLSSNERVYERVSKTEQVKDIEEYSDLYDDVVIENKQAIEMCNIYTDVLGGTMDAFASVISNNVNNVMKILTVITMIITVPTLVASIWGMNVPVPWQTNAYGFWIVVGISLVLTIVAAIFIIKGTNKIRTPKVKRGKRRDK